MTEFSIYESILGFPDLEITFIDRSVVGVLHIHCTLKSDIEHCPSCGERTGIIHQYKTRKVQDLKISDHEVWLHIRVAQFHCPSCGRYFYPTPDWLLKGKSYTKRQSKWIFTLCEQQPFSRVSCLVNLSPKTVERIYYTYANSVLDLASRYAQVRYLGIDELSHKKGKNNYVCVLVDLERGTHLDILPNRNKDTLIAHFKSLGSDFCNQIEVVCCDMWRPYSTVAKECFVNAQVVIDRFHIVKELNTVLDRIRKKLRKDYKDETAFKAIKWQLFKRPENTSNQEKEALQKAFEKSWLLEEVYQLRNTFNAIFDHSKTKEVLEEELNQWISFSKKLDCKYLNSFIKTLSNWKNQIAQYASHKITNAVTEGLNNTIRYIKRISYGLPNFNNMRIRVLVRS